MQFATRGNAFDGDDVGALGLCRKDRAGLYRLAVHVDGAGPALGRVATDMRAGQAEILTKEMNEKGASLDLA
ncbi:hypothetical protein GCM10007908_01910 [Rhizobium albus]|nr:hypothetical protein GCM10007908_01910 [Rhizobium albus]